MPVRPHGRRAPLRRLTISSLGETMQPTITTTWRPTLYRLFARMLRPTMLVLAPTIAFASLNTYPLVSGPTVVQAQGGPQGQTPDERGEGTEKHLPPRIHFTPCPENPAVECGMLTVPVDYTQPRGETVDI